MEITVEFSPEDIMVLLAERAALLTGQERGRWQGSRCWSICSNVELKFVDQKTIDAEVAAQLELDMAAARLKYQREMEGQIRLKEMFCAEQQAQADLPARAESDDSTMFDEAQRILDSQPQSGKAADDDQF